MSEETAVAETEAPKKKRNTIVYTPNEPLLADAVDDYCEALRSAMVAKNIDSKELALRLGISESRVVQILDSKSQNKYGSAPSLKSMVNYLRAVGYAVQFTIADLDAE